jgi:hypothetical protein
MKIRIADDFLDEYRDADTGQGSYLNSHNIDPAVVDSSQFGLLWKVPFNAKEQCKLHPNSQKDPSNKSKSTPNPSSSRQTAASSSFS